LLIFPSLYKRERPERPAHPLILMTFRFQGHLDEIYATLVVRLHYTDAFKYQQLWLNAADFESLTGEKIGLKMSRHEGQGEITVFADGNVSEVSRLMFVKYVHEHLKARDPNCVRIRHYVCDKCKQPFGDQATMDRAREEKQKHVFCGRCGKKIILDDVIERRFGAEETARQAREMQEQAQAVLDNESKELILVGHAFVIAGEAGQTYRLYANSDKGIDGEIEFRNPKGEATAAKLYLQLKSGDSYLTTRKDGNEIFSIKKQHHVEFWREQ
jgi:DNA-directed RNA polymerase subunit RPC12/RpoP